MTLDTILNAIRSNAEKERVDPDLAVAIASQESAFSPWAVRYEQNWIYFVSNPKIPTSLGISARTELECQKMSWGIMQVMGAVARELGFKDHLTKLVDPHLGSLYGCKKLAQIAKKYKDVGDQISAYNGGTPRRDSQGMYLNQYYVKSVLSKMGH